MSEGPDQERGRLSSARRVLKESYDKLSGTEFRERFEEYVDAVTTVTSGLHQEVSELRGRVTELESKVSSMEAARKTRGPWSFFRR